MVFTLKARPVEGAIITATGDVFKRTERPVLVDKDWRLGEIKGVVRKGQKVKVIQVVDQEGDNGTLNVWAEIRPVSQ